MQDTHPRTARTLNIGILAHVDAGKTTLTERLLYETGVIGRPGSVDAGDTRTDTGDIERERGITVRSAVVSFAVGGTQVNLIDTPGHTDFVAEVERALGVLDGAVLVLSAVEGVQAHTRVLMRTLRGLRMPTLLLVNKIDRAGARGEALLADIRRRLAPRIVPMTSVRGEGTRSARAVPRSFAEAGFRTAVAETLAETDDALLERVVDGPFPAEGELRSALAAATADCTAYPVYFGSALSGEGIPALAEGIAHLLPRAHGDRERGAPPRGTVFAVERAPSGRKTAYLRLYEGELAARQRVTFHRDGSGEGERGRTEYAAQITSLDVVRPGGGGPGPLTPGNIARIGGPAGIRVGDTLGEPAGKDGAPHFSPPALETLVRPVESGPGPAARLHSALLALAEQDPLIHARAAPGGGATSVLLYGEVQKEVIAATLLAEHGIEARFEASRPVCLERPAGTAEAYEEMEWRAPTRSGFWATVGLRVEPGPAGSGPAFRYETELGALPRAFHQAVEDSVYACLDGGGPHGWRVTDCVVTLTRSGFVGPKSTAADFRGLTPRVLRRALERCGTRVYEPYHAYEVELPADALHAVTRQLALLRAEIAETTEYGDAWLLRGVIPARQVPEAARTLPALTRGEAAWWSRPSGDGLVPGDRSGTPVTPR
ncbi:translation factor GTPase family protein [Streptomyces sp. ODS28]|uniref:translation factor GTPase family protein n=1 Tax=Streptomyces sp. ODS28 TaxID=3136688 RepID=UPI0031F15F20